MLNSSRFTSYYILLLINIFTLSREECSNNRRFVVDAYFSQVPAAKLAKHQAWMPHEPVLDDPMTSSVPALLALILRPALPGTGGVRRRMTVNLHPTLADTLGEGKG